MSMVGIYRGLVAEALTLSRVAARRYGSSRRARGPFAEASRLPGDTRQGIAAMWGVEAAGSIAYQAVEATVRGQKVRLQVVGSEFDRPGAPPPVVEGRPITHSRYQALTDRRAGIPLGERIALGRDEFVIVGLTENVVASGAIRSYSSPCVTRRSPFELAPPAARRETARRGVYIRHQHGQCRARSSAERVAPENSPGRSGGGSISPPSLRRSRRWFSAVRSSNARAGRSASLRGSCSSCRR